MPRYVALFRGINVGKAKRIAMADLRALLGELGYSDVHTVLNSGNAVFTARAMTGGKLAQRIRAAVADKLGIDALVIVKSASDVAGIIAENVLREVATDDSRLLVAVTNDATSIAALRKYMEKDWGKERMHVGRHAAYLWCAKGILESRVAGALLADLAGFGTHSQLGHVQQDPRAPGRGRRAVDSARRPASRRRTAAGARRRTCCGTRRGVHFLP